MDTQDNGLQLSRPPPRRMAILLTAGLALILCAWAYRVWRRPPEVPAAQARIGIEKVGDVLARIRKTPFGRSIRGRTLTAEAEKRVTQGGVRFSPGLEQEALYRKEFGCRPVLYLSVVSAGQTVLWPQPAELAQRIYHESLHAVAATKRKSRQEECDAFCAAEESAAAVEKRLPRYPVMRDGRTVWRWVQDAYPQIPSDPAYRPLGCTAAELAVRAGIEEEASCRDTVSR